MRRALALAAVLTVLALPALASSAWAATVDLPVNIQRRLAPPKKKHFVRLTLPSGASVKSVTVDGVRATGASIPVGTCTAIMVLRGDFLKVGRDTTAESSVMPGPGDTGAVTFSHGILTNATGNVGSRRINRIGHWWAGAMPVDDGGKSATARIGAGAFVFRGRNYKVDKRGRRRRIPNKVITLGTVVLANAELTATAGSPCTQQDELAIDSLIARIIGSMQLVR